MFFFIYYITATASDLRIIFEIQMFDLVYQAMFGLMVIEMVLFLFLNLPFPKTWKAGFFENLASSNFFKTAFKVQLCLLYTSPSPRDLSTSRMPSSA